VGIPKSLEKTLSEIHIADRVNAFGELHGARKLSVSVAPVVLNSLQMPLVHYNNNFLALSFVKVVKQVLILLIDANTLDLWEESSSCSSVPVH
jgi:hypothetical protein